MILYALKCADEHSFESWFKSAEGFDSLKSAGMVTCPFCGSQDVTKAIMAPRVRPARKTAARPASAPTRGPLSASASPAELAQAEMRKKIEANSDYVGLSFAAEARKMHDGDIPHRSIYGEARADEAKKLLEDGVPVAPLPFIPTRKTN